MVEFNPKEIDTIKYDRILSSDSESDRNQCSNLEGFESESSMIQFGSPYCLSLSNSSFSNLERWEGEVLFEQFIFAC